MACSCQMTATIGYPNRTCSEPLEDSVELFLEGLRCNQHVKLEELTTTAK